MQSIIEKKEEIINEIYRIYVAQNEFLSQKSNGNQKINDFAKKYNELMQINIVRYQKIKQNSDEIYNYLGTLMSDDENDNENENENDNNNENDAKNSVKTYIYYRLEYQRILLSCLELLCLATKCISGVSIPLSIKSNILELNGKEELLMLEMEERRYFGNVINIFYKKFDRLIDSLIVLHKMGNIIYLPIIESYFHNCTKSTIYLVNNNIRGNNKNIISNNVLIKIEYLLNNIKYVETRYKLNNIAQYLLPHEYSIVCISPLKLCLTCLCEKMGNKINGNKIGEISRFLDNIQGPNYEYENILEGIEKILNIKIILINLYNQKNPTFIDYNDIANKNYLNIDNKLYDLNVLAHQNIKSGQYLGSIINYNSTTRNEEKIKRDLEYEKIKIQDELKKQELHTIDKKNDDMLKIIDQKWLHGKGINLLKNTNIWINNKNNSNKVSIPEKSKAAILMFYLGKIGGNDMFGLGENNMDGIIICESFAQLPNAGNILEIMRNYYTKREIENFLSSFAEGSQNIDNNLKEIDRLRTNYNLSALQNIKYQNNVDEINNEISVISFAKNSTPNIKNIIANYNKYLYDTLPKISKLLAARLYFINPNNMSIINNITGEDKSLGINLPSGITMDLFHKQTNQNIVLNKLAMHKIIIKKYLENHPNEKPQIISLLNYIDISIANLKNI